ncbi:MAG: hypothetical protein A2097_05430 [Desulfobacula sp. GWF2_41_7]|nr:MAG: hypothetical protein A2097_05430 [Desulfobacula sp. GWF2_41_7]
MGKNRFHFFISGEEEAVFPGSRLWELPLSGIRSGREGDFPSESASQGSKITVGDYFLASCEVLSGKEFLILRKGLGAVFSRPVSKVDIAGVSVFLEKHGAFYHPLKIRVELKNSQTCFFVLNGAVSGPGLSLIETEYALISRLNKFFLKSYLPRIFGLDILETQKGRIGFFLGEWFQDYKEFHVTGGSGQRKIVIWESDGSCRYLPEKSMLPVYREAARILTFYYNIDTFEQIYPWHHAAGDFIVREAGGRFHVRLVTVRGYSPLTEFGSDEADQKNHILPSLLVFFFTLSLKMRLDRIDGTGEAVMLGDGVLTTIVDGFLDALDEKSKVYDYGDLRQVFTTFLNGFSLDQIMNTVAAILESCDWNPVENLLIKENLESHCRILQSVFKTL